jgi:hypothetical protein
MQLSDEQMKVIDVVSKNNSIIIDAVAGSGKTTTIIEMAKILSNKFILQITYNAHLKKEVKEKAYIEKVENIEIHTYHSLCLKYYNCYKDEQIKNLLKYDVEPKKNIPSYSIIVIDEIQDMRSLYYNMILKFIGDLGKKIPIIVCGDKYQGIYEFSDADTRFLTHANKIYNGYEDNFIRLNFKTSYRVTNQVAKFLNKHVIGYDRIISGSKNDKSCPVKYVVFDKNKDESIDFIVREITNKIKMGYKPSDFFIMSYTIKKNNFFKKIENILSSMKIYIYYESGEEEKTLDSKLIDNKLVFTTIHCAKGRERKFVFFDGFDSSFDYYCEKSKKNPKFCSSELYVALTRASQELYLLHDSKKHSIGCLLYPNFSEKDDYIDMIYLDDPKPQKEYKSIKNIFSVTDLLNHLGTTIIDIQPKIDELMIQIVKPNTVLSIKDTIYDPHKNITENVTDINGLVIPMIFESLHNKKDCYILSFVKNKISNFINDDYLIDKIINMKFTKNTKIEDYITIGIYYLCICNGLLHKVNQIIVRDWLNMNDIKLCHEYLSKNLGSELEWEKNIGKNKKHNNNVFCYKHKKYGTIEICGRVDAIDDKNVWELKCVNNLILEHKLQLIIYYFIFTKENENIDKNYKLLNMKSGEVFMLTKDNDKINYIMEKIFETKVIVKNKIDDEEFINLCKSSKYHEKLKNLNISSFDECVTEEQKLDRLDLIKLKDKAKKLKINNFSKMKKENLINEIIMCIQKTGKYKKCYGMF